MPYIGLLLPCLVIFFQHQKVFSKENDKALNQSRRSSHYSAVYVDDVDEEPDFRAELDLSPPKVKEHRVDTDGTDEVPIERLLNQDKEIAYNMNGFLQLNVLKAPLQKSNLSLHSPLATRHDSSLMRQTMPSSQSDSLLEPESLT